MEDLERLVQGVNRAQGLSHDDAVGVIDELFQGFDQPASPASPAETAISLFNAALDKFEGDPRRMLSVLQMLTRGLVSNREATLRGLDRFLGAHREGGKGVPDPFDWTMVDFLFSRLEQGSENVFTMEMKVSICDTLFGNCDHAFREMVNQVLSVCVGEPVRIVRDRVFRLSHASLRDVAMLLASLRDLEDRSVPAREAPIIVIGT